MTSNSVKAKCSDAYDEGIVQGVVKATQTRILWSTVQVCHVLPGMKATVQKTVAFFLKFACTFNRLTLTGAVNKVHACRKKLLLRM